MKKILGVLVVIMLMFIERVDAEYIINKEHSIVKRGDVIYFDATGLDWSNIYIHLWEDGGDVYKDWSNNDEMTKVEGTDNIYMFNVPNDIEEKYNMVIFHNLYGGDSNQTIDLSYIETNLAYLVNDYRDGKRIGYWYLYDKTELLEHLQTLHEYQQNKQYYTSSSYGNLDELITNIEGEINGEIRLEKVDSAVDQYYLQVDVLFQQTDNIVDNLQVDPTELNDLIEELEEQINDFEKEYTKASVDDLKEIISDLKNILNDEINVDDINNGITELNDALDDLVKQADKKELIKEIEEISKLDKNKYEFFEEIEKLLEEAKEIKYDTNALQDDVDVIVEKIKEAISKLKEKKSIQLNETKDEINETKDEINEIKDETEKIENAPKTLDDIVKIFGLFGVALVAFIVVIFLIKKNRKLK